MKLSGLPENVIISRVRQKRGLARLSDSARSCLIWKCITPCVLYTNTEDTYTRT